MDFNLIQTEISIRNYRIVREKFPNQINKIILLFESNLLKYVQTIEMWKKISAKHYLIAAESELFFLLTPISSIRIYLRRVKTFQSNNCSAI